MTDSRNLSPPPGGTPITFARLPEEIEAARDLCRRDADEARDVLPRLAAGLDTEALRLDALARQIRSAGLAR